MTVTDICHLCEYPGRLRDHVTRKLIDLPIAGYPTELRVLLPRFTCTNTTCRREVFHSPLPCVEERSKVTTRVARWILQRLAIDRKSISAIAKALALGWKFVNSIGSRDSP